MGPRPFRRASAAEPGRPAPKPPRLLVVESAAPRAVVKPSSRHVTPPDTAPLPAPVVAALGAIATDLRHLPRDCVGDAGELLFWLRRQAARVDGVAALRIATAPPRPRRPPPAPPGRDLAEAVFGKATPLPSLPGPRSVTSRHGRRVAVEIRRARERGQAELPW